MIQAMKKKKYHREMSDCIRVIKGNLLTSNENVIIHQVNCQGVMGAGIAKQIKDKYPMVFSAYKKYCPNPQLLGKIQYIRVNDDRYIINLFGQNGFGRDKRYTDYSALRTGIRKALDFAADRGYKSVGIPYMIGCGLAGANETTVAQIIFEEIKANPKCDNMVVNCYSFNNKQRF